MRCSAFLLVATALAGCSGAETPSRGLSGPPPPASLKAPALTVASEGLDHPVTEGQAASGEAQVVADPSRPGHAVAAFLDFRGNPQIAVRRTTDGGRTWVETGVFRSLQPDLWTADPTLAFAPDGALYLAYLQSIAREPHPRGGGLYVVRSDDGGATWGDPVLATRSWDQGLCSGQDKEMIAAGPDGRVHLAYTDFTSTSSTKCDTEGGLRVAVVTSRDGGRTFEDPVPITVVGENGSAAMPRVLPDGTLLVSHILFPGDGVCGSPTVAVVVQRSTDGGRTFTRHGAGESCFGSNSGLGAPLAANSIPVLWSDADGRAAVAWVAAEAGGEDNAVLVRVSADGGRTWSELPPVAAGLPVALQTMISYGPDGRLHAFYYGAQPGGVYDSFLTSFDGRAWGEPTKLNSAPSTGATGQGFGIGHYPGLDVGPDGLAYPMWSDAREQPAYFSFHLWTRTVRVGGARPFTPSPPPAVAPPPAGAPADAPPAASRARVRVRRTRRGFAVTVALGATPRSLRVELRKGRRTVARARRPLAAGTRSVRLRARARGRFLLRVAAIDAAGGRVVVVRRVRR